MDDNVIPLWAEGLSPCRAAVLERQRCVAERMRQLSIERRPINRLAAELGTPEDWLDTAVVHLKTRAEAHLGTGGSVTVSVAALNLVLTRLDQLECGTAPWPGNAA